MYAGITLITRINTVFGNSCKNPLILLSPALGLKYKSYPAKWNGAPIIAKPIAHCNCAKVCAIALFYPFFFYINLTLEGRTNPPKIVHTSLPIQKRNTAGGIGRTLFVSNSSANALSFNMPVHMFTGVTTANLGTKSFLL